MANTGTMTDYDIKKWLEAHQGQKNYQDKYEEIPNPNYDAKTATATSEQPKTRQKHRIWTANDGQVLEVLDDAPATAEEQRANVDKGRSWYNDDGSYTHGYTVVRIGDPDNTDTRSPEKKQDEARDSAEREWNVANGPTPNPNSPAYNKQDADAQRGSGLNETHSERAIREAKERDQKRAEDDDKARRDKDALDAQNRASELNVAGARAEEDARHNKAQEEESGRQTDIAGRNADSAARNADTSAAAEAARAETARATEARENRTPHVIGTPTSTDKSIAYIDPASGEIRTGANPLYDQKKAEADFEKERLRLLIEQNKMTAEVAAAQYKQWYDKNVAAPLAMAAERRAQAAEQRQALQAEEQRRQFQSSNDVARAGIGEQAASRAVDAEKSLLPYRVGGTFAGNMSSAINGLAAGGKMDANAASGVHFQASDFTFKAPNFAKIAKNATADALKHLTPYRPSDQDFSVGDYTGLSLPNQDTLGTAPADPSYIDTATGVNNLANPYSVPSGS
jgi:hypothetical protein